MRQRKENQMDAQLKCPNCKQNVFAEEVMMGVTQYTGINSIDEELETVDDYNGENASYEGGDIDSIYYQCPGCGYDLGSSIGVLIETIKENPPD